MNEDYTIRKAKIEDLIELQTLNKKLFKYEYKGRDKDINIEWPFKEEGKTYFETKINNKLVIIALFNDKIIGYLCRNDDAKNEYEIIEIAEIENMYVEEEYRGNWVGSKLIEEFKKECKEKNIETFKVNASWENKNAIAMYKKNGFIEHDITLWCKI